MTRWWGANTCGKLCSFSPSVSLFLDHCFRPLSRFRWDTFGIQICVINKYTAIIPIQTRCNRIDKEKGRRWEKDICVWLTKHQLLQNPAQSHRSFFVDGNMLPGRSNRIRILNGEHELGKTGHFSSLTAMISLVSGNKIMSICKIPWKKHFTAIRPRQFAH